MDTSKCSRTHIRYSPNMFVLKLSYVYLGQSQSKLLLACLGQEGKQQRQHVVACISQLYFVIKYINLHLIFMTLVVAVILSLQASSVLDRKNIVLIMFPSVVMWGLQKLRNSICFQNYLQKDVADLLHSMVGGLIQGAQAKQAEIFSTSTWRIGDVAGEIFILYYVVFHDRLFDPRN